MTVEDDYIVCCRHRSHCSRYSSFDDCVPDNRSWEEASFDSRIAYYSWAAHYNLDRNCSFDDPNCGSILVRVDIVEEAVPIVVVDIAALEADEKNVAAAMAVVDTDSVDSSVEVAAVEHVAAVAAVADGAVLSVSADFSRDIVR